MNRKFLSGFFLLILLFPGALIAQNESTDSLPADPQYREDQFYLGLSVNFLSQLPQGIDQSGFSGSARFGFLRDMPVNNRRNVGFALGAGLSINTYNQNLKIDDTGTETTFSRLDNDDFNSNGFSTYIAEVPFQLRWRTSTQQKNKFWRIYLGFKAGYLFYFKSNFESGETSISVNSPNGLQRWRYSLTFSGGYSKVNFYLDYSLNNLFSEVTMDAGSSPVQIQPIKAGLIFYIL